MRRGLTATLAIAAVTVAAFLIISLGGAAETASLQLGFIPLRLSLDVPGAWLPVWLTPLSATLVHAGFRIIATGGTASHLEGLGLPVERVNKVAQGRPHIVDKLTDGNVQLVFNTTEGWQSLKDSFSIRSTALNRKVPYFTTAAASLAAARSIKALRGHALEVKALQSYYSASER